jgi:copper resistance protein D
MSPIAIVRAVHFAATLLVAGAFAFRLLMVREADGGRVAEPVRADIGRWLHGAAGSSVTVALLSWFAWLALVAATMNGGSLAQALAPQVLWTVITQTTFGHVWTLRFLLAAFIALQLFWRRGRTVTEVLEIDGGAAAALLLVSLAWAGHAVGTEGALRPWHLAADALHLLAAGLWLGALVPLFVVLGRARTRATPAWHTFATSATRRFSSIGMVAATALLASGAASAWLLVGSVAALTATVYGLLVSAKAMLFVLILLVAAVNRFSLTPALQSQVESRSAGALRALWRNVILELVMGAAILLIVGEVGTLPPAAHQHGGDTMQMHMHLSHPGADDDEHSAASH